MLLVTSRYTKRWVLPKGNIPEGASDAEAVRLEALEEAGLTGVVAAEPLGRYRYSKWAANGGFRVARVRVYPLQVLEELDEWKEKGERERRWFSLADACDALDEDDLRILLRGFIPPELSKMGSIGPRGGAGIRSRVSDWWRSLVRRDG